MVYRKSEYRHHFLTEWQAAANALFRLVVGGLFSSFMFEYCGVNVTILWMIAVVLTEVVAFRLSNKLPALWLNMLLWVLSGVLIWQRGAEIPHVAFTIIQFNVALYAAVIYHRNPRVMWLFMAPSILVMAAFFAEWLWTRAPQPFGYVAIFAMLGGLSMPVMLGLVMNSTFRNLEEARARLEDANRAKDVFLANMSHEIRTPLNGIIGLAAALSETLLPSREHEMVELIHQSGATLERLLSDLLDVSKIEAGVIEVEAVPFDLRSTLDSAVHVMIAVAEDKGLEVRIDYAETAAGYVIGDAVRIRQIVSNLVSNAVKFTAAGSVDIGVALNGETLTVRVRDTGIGFTEDTKRRLFRRFEQGDPSITRKYGGTGLGLAISREIALRLGGDITAASTPGLGSTFILSLPVRRLEAPPEPVPEAVTVPLQGASVSVLVAEDHPVNQRTFRVILEAMGASVTLAANGAEAVAAWEADRFDLILMDMQMPIMDGLTATRTIRAREAKDRRARTVIAMLSANVTRHHIDQALESGCDFHMSKPITPARLAEGIRRALDGTFEPSAAEAHGSA